MIKIICKVALLPCAVSSPPILTVKLGTCIGEALRGSVTKLIQIIRIAKPSIFLRMDLFTFMFIFMFIHLSTFH